MKQRRIRTAGPLVQVVDRPRSSARDDAAVRGAKRNLSTEAQRRANVKFSWQKLMWKLAANFLPGDLIVTLTYDDDHLPASRKEAKARLKKFRERMAKSRRARGESFVAVYATEHLHSSERPGEDGRWHHHMVLNATGDDFREILAAWGFGSNVEIRRLELSESRSYETLAKYMAKERSDTANSHVWSCTRNCRKPETESFAVPDDAPIVIPEGAVHVRRETKETEYGRFEIVTYLGAAPRKLRKRKAKSRRKR